VTAQVAVVEWVADRQAVVVVVVRVSVRHADKPD